MYLIFYVTDYNSYSVSCLNISINTGIAEQRKQNTNYTIKTIGWL